MSRVNICHDRASHAYPACIDRCMLRRSGLPSTSSCAAPASAHAFALKQREPGAAAGSKIKVTSIIHMAWELAALLLAYQVGPTQLRTPLLPVDGSIALAVSPSTLSPTPCHAAHAM